MPTIRTTIHIAASPALVRAAFLDFSSLSTYHTTFFSSIRITSGPSPALTTNNGTTLSPTSNPKSTLAVTINPRDESGKGSPMTLYPPITTNTEREFAWTGRPAQIPGVFTGMHSFHFEEGEEGGTMFVQQEVFTGVAAGFIGEGSGMHAKTKRGFEAFNRDLKVRCEAVAKAS